MADDLRTDIHLRRLEENSADIEAAAEKVGRRVGLEGVLEHLNRQATRFPVPGLAVDHGFRWQESDVHSLRWWPQGVTTSADGEDGETVSGHRLLLTSWYSKDIGGQNHGSRITVVDLETLRYRHVLLVRPHVGAFGRVRLEPLLAHAGGLTWFGPYLHVAGTRRGLFSCRLDDVLEMRSTEQSLGYRYVLPIRFGYAAAASEGVEQMRYSFLSLDRGTRPPQLVAGEYGRASMTRRLVRFDLDPESGHLAAQEDGVSYPARLDDRGLGHMQGVAVVGGTYYVTVSRGQRLLGRINVGRPGSFRRIPRSLPPGPEDLTYWPSTDLLWSLTEWPGRRFVFAVRRSTLDR